MNNYYTYAYLREDGTPYYIGKGKNKRVYVKARTVPLPIDKSKIIFLKLMRFSLHFNCFLNKTK